MIIVYIVFYDMENDTPDAYCLEEEDAKRLLAGSEVGDYIKAKVHIEEWMQMLTGGR